MDSKMYTFVMVLNGVTFQSYFNANNDIVAIRKSGEKVTEHIQEHGPANFKSVNCGLSEIDRAGSVWSWQWEMSTAKEKDVVVALREEIYDVNFASAM